MWFDCYILAAVHASKTCLGRTRSPSRSLLKLSHEIAFTRKTMMHNNIWHCSFVFWTNFLPCCLQNVYCWTSAAFLEEVPPEVVLIINKMMLHSKSSNRQSCLCEKFNKLAIASANWSIDALQACFHSLSYSMHHYFCFALQHFVICDWLCYKIWHFYRTCAARTSCTPQQPHDKAVQNKHSLCISSLV